jgi:hypothetical protein
LPPFEEERRAMWTEKKKEYYSRLVDLKQGEKLIAEKRAMWKEKKKEYYSRLVEQSLKQGEKLIAEISYAYDKCPRHSQLSWGIFKHLVTVAVILADLRRLQRNLEEGRLGEPTLASIWCLVNSLRKAQRNWVKFFRKEKLGILFL